MQRLLALLVFYFSFTLIDNCIAQTRYRPVRIDTDIKLDGKLLEPQWNLSQPLTSFMQSEPVSGAAPSEYTEVRMLYNDIYLYVGFHCYDSMPAKLIRLFMDRDFDLGKDDGIAVSLDSYNDKNTSVIFITNTLSARFDAEATGNGNDMNTDYNNFWDVASVVDTSGYTCEYRIPFSSLRFEQKENVIMGFRFARLIKRKNELITYPRCDTTLQNQWCNTSQEAELEFENLKTKKPIYISPYVIGNFDQQQQLNAAGDHYEKRNVFFVRKNYVNNEALDKIISNLGADIKYGLTKNFTLNVTLNTDFAQAEVDNRIINLTKYAVNLPEKRNFFLEAQNNLNYQVGQSTQLFNSRTIGLQGNTVVPIIAGIRLTGRQDNWTIGTLNMQTANVKSENIGSQNFTVARLRKFYGSRGSFWGGIVTNRISTGNNSVSNQSVALDAVHRFNDKWLAGFGTAATFDEKVKSTFDNNSFINIFAFKSVIEGFIHGLNFEYVGSKFNPAMGFNAETDYGFLSLYNGKRTRFKHSRIFNFWAVFANTEYRWKLAENKTETKFLRIDGELNWKRGSFLSISPFAYKEDRLYSNWQLDDHITVPADYYTMRAADIRFNYDVAKNYTFNFYAQLGDFYGGTIFNTASSINYVANRYLRFAINYEYNTISFPRSFSNNDHSVFNSNLIAFNVTITQSSKFSVKMLTQYDDLTNSFGGNIRIRYNPREGNDLFLVYNSSVNTNRPDAKPTLPLVDRQALVIKYIVTFGL